ncbi:carbon-nitrogen family hydrolase [Desulfoluna sp.]|uniref:carbon-nitrogen family hydrolase n=1 Tax=Desulfoluna sp. TaxID=2045199 RepID=UPI00262C5513|nr:carbon-nitrogen family hydrolase [Desulfoluna sp.]
MNSSVVAGIVQFDVVEGALEANLTRGFQGIMRLAEAGCDLAVLPEMWSCGFDHAHLVDMAKSTPGILARLQALAARERMVVAGSLPEVVDGAVVNTLHVVDRDGEIKGGYRKLHLFTPTGEDAHFSAGQKAVVADTSIGRLGLMICYDLRFPELARGLVLDGAEILVIPAQWPATRLSHWEALLKARAIENQCFVVGANRVGRSGGLVYKGGSQIVSPLGETLAHAGSAEGEVVGAMESEEMTAFRTLVPCLEERRPMCYSRKLTET